MPGQPVIVLKFGSSVLTAESSIPVAVHEIYRWYRRGYRVIAVVSAGNSSSIRVLEKLGMRFERMFSMSPAEPEVRLYGIELPAN